MSRIKFPVQRFNVIIAECCIFEKNRADETQEAVAVVPKPKTRLFGMQLQVDN